jgi:hypothetical protein
MKFRHPQRPAYEWQLDEQATAAQAGRSGRVGTVIE